MIWLGPTSISPARMERRYEEERRGRRTREAGEGMSERRREERGGRV